MQVRVDLTSVKFSQTEKRVWRHVIPGLRTIMSTHDAGYLSEVVYRKFYIV